MISPKEIDVLLNYDPMDTVEKFVDGINEVAGRIGADHIDYKERNQMILGEAIRSNQAKQKALLENGDTTISNEYDRYISILGKLGFERVFHRKFPSKYEEFGNEMEEQCIYFHYGYGILLVFDTFGRDINAAKFYYAYDYEKSQGTSSSIHSSGGYECFSKPGWWRVKETEGVPVDVHWFGDHDAREALVHKIAKLADRGGFLPTWPAAQSSQRFIYLATYTEDDGSSGDGWKEISERILQDLPESVRKQLNITF